MASAQSPADTAAAFVRLRTLAGQWDATEKGNPSFAETVTYSMTGRGTVLVEDMRATSMGHMLTAYHLDKGRLVLTHSCGAGNQPNMRLRVIEEGRRRLQFELHDITNLSSPEAYHSTRVNVSFVGETRVDLEYRGSAGSRETVQVFQLVRKKTSIVRMYVPKHFEETDLAVLHRLIRSRPLGTWVAWANGELIVNHLPCLRDASEGAFGRLIGHAARANQVWKELAAGTPSVVVFQGTEKYITPSWYPSKHETGKAVPTWNYVVVHAHGSPRVIHDKDWLRGHVSELSERHEYELPTPWKLTDAPPEYIDVLLNAIVGNEIPLEALQGQWKLGQNRSVADLAGVVTGLSADRDDASIESTQLTATAVKAKLTGS